MLRSALFRSLTIGSQGRLVSSSVSGEGFDAESLKKPPNGYLAFMSEFRASSNETTMKALVKAGSEKWRQLPEETRQTYKEGAKAQREAWQERVSKLKEDPKAREALEEVAFAAKQKRDKRALKRAVHAKQELEEETKKPKRYALPVSLYLKEKFPEYRMQRPHEKTIQLTAIILENWKMLPEESKAKYKEESEKMKMEYLKAVSKWKEELMASGKIEELDKLAQKVRKERMKSKASISGL